MEVLKSLRERFRDCANFNILQPHTHEYNSSLNKGKNIFWIKEKSRREK